MKKFRLSLIYILLLFATSPLHKELENLLFRFHLTTLVFYTLTVVFAALFLYSFVRVWNSWRMIELAALLTASFLLAFFLFQRSLVINHYRFGTFLHICEFFFMGYLLMKENKKEFSFIPYFILLTAALAFEWIQKLLPGRFFDIQDIWLNGLSGFIGLIFGFF